MPELSQTECRKFYETTCQQKAQEVLLNVRGLIKQAIDANPAMADSVKLKVAAGLLEDSQYRIVLDNESKPVVFEMAPAVLPNGNEVDLWQAIVDDRKVIDVRARTENYDSLDVDNIVCFQRSSDGARVLRRIGLIFRADGLKQLVGRIVTTGLFYGNHATREQRVISHIIPGLEALGELVQAINSFSDYAEKIKQYGVIAFVLMPLTAKKLETGTDAGLDRYGWRREDRGDVEVFVRDD